jgi:DNA-binding response OmpR family regulator
MFVSRLRRKVDAGFATPLIHTVHACGYVLGPPADTGLENSNAAAAGF